MQSTPDTIIIPRSPEPSSPLSEVMSGDHSSDVDLSDTTHSADSIPKPEYTLFQPLRRLSHYPTYDHCPIGFAYQPERWYPFWNLPAVDITNRLIPREPSVAPYTDTPSMIHTEGEFDSIPLRLKPDPLKSTDLEPF
jgi:hypothetical protein